MVIEPSDWVLAYDRQVSGKRAPAEFVVRWKVIPLFVDIYEPPTVDDPAREHPVVLVSDLPAGRHTLELVAEGDPPLIRVLRVHEPPFP